TTAEHVADLRRVSGRDDPAITIEGEEVAVRHAALLERVEKAWDPTRAVSDPDVTHHVLGRPGTHVRPLACDRRAELLHRAGRDFCQLPPGRLLEGAPRTRERDEGDQGPGDDDQQDRESLQLGP